MSVNLSQIIEFVGLPTTYTGYATGEIFFDANPVDGDTVTFCGLTFTFAAAATGYYIQIGEDIAETIQNMKTIADLFTEIPDTFGEPASVVQYLADRLVITCTVEGDAGLSVTMETDSGDRIIPSGPALSLEGGIESVTGIDPAKSDSDYEVAVLSLIEVIASIIAYTDDPAADPKAVRRQRMLLKRVLQWAAIEVPVPVATRAVDDRETVYDVLRTRLNRRYHTLAAND